MPYLIDIKDRHGQPGRPLIIQGDPFVVIDGHDSATPMRIRDCSYFILRDWNLANSDRSTLWMSGCHHYHIERVCAWNANPKENHKPFDVSHTSQGHILDCAAWGTGRKTVNPSQGGDDLTWRRCWARYDGCDMDGSKMTYCVAYNNHRNYFWHCLGVCATAPETYWHYRGVFGIDRIDDRSLAHTLVDHCVAFNKSQYPIIGFDPGHESYQPIGVTYRDCINATHPENPIDERTLLPIIHQWQNSPIIDRLADYANANPLADLMALLSTAPPEAPKDQ